MAGRTVEEIREKVNIVDVVGQVVSLKRTGINHKGLCPFHNEKTPSFVVSEQRQSFICFCCGAHGDVISFVEKYYGLSFLEAVEKIGAQYGIKVDRGRRQDDGERELFYALNHEAATFYFRRLRQGANPGLSYAASRGLSKETLHTFGIGYADESWSGLYDHLKAKGYKDDILVQSGLISESKGKHFDKFRNRLMFPIQNTAGKIIGFGGRIIGPGEPKYLNSPETPVFRKKNNLYGLYQTKGEALKQDRLILVEGYMDAVSLYQGGIRNVAASLGTALTENQARLIKRYTKNAILSYDSDGAGVKAALRGMDILKAEGMNVRVLHVTDGKDPDDFIKRQGKEAFLKLTEEALPYVDYKIQQLEKAYNLQDNEGRADFLKAVVEVLRTLSPVEGDLYAGEIARTYGISQEALRRQLLGETPLKSPVPSRRRQEEQYVLTPAEHRVLQILLEEPTYLEQQELEQLFAEGDGYPIYSAMRDLYRKGEKPDTAALLDILGDDQQELLMSLTKSSLPAGSLETLFAGCLKKAHLEKLLRRQKSLLDQLSMAEEETNQEDIHRLSRELIQVQTEIAATRKA